MLPSLPGGSGRFPPRLQSDDGVRTSGRRSDRVACPRPCRRRPFHLHRAFRGFCNVIWFVRSLERQLSVVIGSWLLVPGSWFLVLGCWFFILGSVYSVACSLFPI